MTAQELMSLAERCEAATGADRELVPLECLPRTARNRFGQVATLWTTTGLERQLALRARASSDAGGREPA